MREESYMVAVPSDGKSIYDVKGMMERVSGVSGIKILSHNFDESLQLKIEADKTEYEVEVNPIELKIPEMYRIQHFFPDIDIEAVENAEVGLEVVMEFGRDALASYHVQLKLIHALIPDAVAVLDHSSEKILSGKWIGLAADSDVPPAPRYIYTVQAVAGEEEDCVWLHSHGLNRCGLPELEILNSTKEMYQTHYSIIETMANRMLEFEEPLLPKEPLYLARLAENIPFVATLVEWQEAIELYPRELLGGKDDRKESHNENTCAVFVYQTSDDMKQEKYVPVTVFDQYLKGNPIYMISDRETARMKRLAGERLSYMRKAFENPENKILVKVGLKIDEEFSEDENEREHIWFELLDVLDGKIKGKLTQEPYYVKDIHEGSEGFYSFGEITDWLIYTKERRITPDDVYLLD